MSMKSRIHNLLTTHLKSGRIEVAFADGEIRAYGVGEGPTPRLRFADKAAERSVLLDPELRIGELFMDGRLSVENGRIADVLMILGSLDAITVGPITTRILALARIATRRYRQYNSLASARANIKHHYDLESGLYEAFLDSDKQYSCAYFETDESTLEEAQLAKKRHIVAKLRLEPGMRVLDIGSGWGGLGLYLARHTGAEVVGVTLSDTQHRISNERAKSLGVEGQVRFKLVDYREVEGEFDRIVSVGMFEHVGVDYYKIFFAKCRELLRPDGVMLLHTIGRVEPRGGANPWIQKYIFPGGYIPSISEMAEAIERTGLRTTDIEILRHHYARTLRCWRQRFLAKRDVMLTEFGERFCRMWEFYLAACEMAFVHRNLSVFQWQLTRRIDALPITRDYMREASDRLRLSEAGNAGTDPT